MRKAQLQFKLKDEAGADASLRQALELAPGHREALLALIQLERRRGRPSEALAYAGKLVGVSQKGTPSERAAAYRESARLKFELSDEAGAREDCARAFESMPGDVEVLSMLVEAGSSSPRETLALVEKHRPAGAELQAPWLALRGLTRARLKEAAGARDDFAAAVAADAKGICFGELFQARRDLLDPAFFDRCLERFPGSAALYSDRGVARCGLGRTDGAASDFRKAIELSPEFLEARLNLASVLASQNRRAEALVETDKAVAAAKDPGSPVYARLLELQASLREPTAKIK
jgi:tetratricopeptide (TPR) repeat protein